MPRKITEIIEDLAEGRVEEALDKIDSKPHVIHRIIVLAGSQREFIDHMKKIKQASDANYSYCKDESDFYRLVDVARSSNERPLLELIGTWFMDDWKVKIARNNLTLVRL